MSWILEGKHDITERWQNSIAHQERLGPSQSHDSLELQQVAPMFISRMSVENGAVKQEGMCSPNDISDAGAQGTLVKMSLVNSGSFKDFQAHAREAVRGIVTSVSVFQFPMR